MSKALAAVPVGLFTFSSVVLFGLTAGYIVLAPERVFEAESRDATPLWGVAVIAVALVGGWFGGFACRLYARSTLPARAFAALVLLGGIAWVAFLATTPASTTPPAPIEEADIVTMQRDLWGARLPLWAAVLAPLAGAGAISFGAAVFDRLKRDDAGRPSV